MSKFLSVFGWSLVAAGALTESYVIWLVVATLALTGCQPYWVRTGPALTVESVTEVDNIYAHCYRAGFVAGTKTFGCTVTMYMGLPTARIFLLRGVSPEDRACVLRHEEKGHAEGWSHDERETYRLDCGPTS